MPLRKRLLVCWLAAMAASAAIADDRKVNNEAEIRHTMQLDAPAEDHACQAALELEYYQAGDEVHVESQLTNPDCAASSGSYTIEVRLRDDDGESSKKRFEETWSRADDSAIRLERNYPVGDGVLVTRVRPRKLRCECTVDEAYDAAPVPEPISEH